MRVLAIILALGLFGGSTVWAFMASTQGWGLPGLLDKPVSIRQQSVRRSRTGGVALIYFGSRRYRGGGFGYGK